MPRTGYVAIIGRPNAGKSSLINAVLGEKISMVSKKANATRKRSLAIHMYKDHQIIFIDTPGIHEKERLLNEFMLEESLKAMGECDLIVFLAPCTDDLKYYEDFLNSKPKAPHILVLSKKDTLSQAELLNKITKYQQYQDDFKALIPLSSKKKKDIEAFCKELIKHLPEHPYLYDTQILTTQNLKQIYKEFIRESIFEYTSDEIPYSSDVLIDKFEEHEDIHKVFATIIVERKSQKGIIIGKDASTLKRIGMHSRTLMQKLSGTKIFLKLFVQVRPNWTKDEQILKKLGYNGIL